MRLLLTLVPLPEKRPPFDLIIPTLKNIWKNWKDSLETCGNIYQVSSPIPLLLFTLPLPVTLCITKGPHEPKALRDLPFATRRGSAAIPATHRQ